MNWAEPSGNIGSEKRMKPYPPSFSSTPARITEPAVGAWTCASGSQVWTGHIGILTANEEKKGSHSQVCTCGGKSYAISAGMDDVPAVAIMYSIAISITTEPSSV